MNDMQRRVIIALAQNDMSINGAAKAMCYYRSTIDYHISRIRDITGLNPRKFFDLIKLYEMATKERVHG